MEATGGLGIQYMKSLLETMTYMQSVDVLGQLGVAIACCLERERL
jgi:hypothetical protein